VATHKDNVFLDIGTFRTARRKKSPSVAGIITLLEREYGRVHYHQRLDPVSELVGTILSQNTSDANSHRAFQSLRQIFPTWDVLMNADVLPIADAIRAGGLADIKAGRIKAVLRHIKEERGSLDLTFLRDMPLQEAKAWLRKLPGVGPKTTAIVLCFALGMPAMPVDTHVYRVVKRLGLIGSGVNAERAHDLLEAKVPAKDVYAFHVLLISHGRRTCKSRRPRCGACVLGSICPSRDLLVEDGLAA
jgi:endonuclease-3